MERPLGWVSLGRAYVNLGNGGVPEVCRRSRTFRSHVQQQNVQVVSALCREAFSEDADVERAVHEDLESRTPEISANSGAFSFAVDKAPQVDEMETKGGSSGEGEDENTSAEEFPSDGKGDEVDDVAEGLGDVVHDEDQKQDIMAVAERIRQEGKVYQEQGKLVLAKELYRKAVELAPKLGKGWQNLARVERRIGGSPGDSLVIIKEALSHDPENSYLWLTCGVLEQERGNKSQAREMFRKGLECDRTQVAVYVSWARFESMEGNYELARKLYMEGTRHDPMCERLYHSWAIMEARVGNAQRAEELFKQGLEVDPKNTYLWHGLGRIAVEQNKPEKARYCFEKALNENPDNSVVLYSLAYMELYRAKDYDAARRLFERALEIDPMSTKVLVLYSKLEMHEENFAEAAALAEQAIQASPTDTDAIIQLAVVESFRENHSYARQLFKRVIELHPRNMDAYYRWGTMEWRAGNRELANKLLQKCRTSTYNYEQYIDL
uniref:UDP-N-acetylglucosamine--peptide N-acetylglucosaminyltransferase SPINDLY n=1 Tax=Rhodosorus marinus TaxID=101924 RepID=A0A7S3EBL0_9RHOD|mmetsp:Transcript_20815/g.84814  ORF Transcript_20815/g.84814 Transcript_20815/m.84814 type:complete len:494 (+) Transcript_20815:149-1630(+)